MTNKLNKGGFTLIELLVVVLIIGILSSIALPQYTKAVEKSRAAEGQSFISDWIQGQTIYHMANGDYAAKEGTAVNTNLDVALPTSLKNFTIADSSSGTEAKIVLTRTNSSMPYTLEASITHDNDTGRDNAVRYCSTNEKACLSISNGRTCASGGDDGDFPWCYKAAA